jgi:uncharacterized repeat protein (TIGR02543 family)
VKFSAEGGSTPKNGKKNLTSKTVVYDQKWGTLPTTTWSNVPFQGWYTAAIGGDLVTESADVKITANQTIYAHWTPPTSIDPPTGMQTQYVQGAPLNRSLGSVVVKYPGSNRTVAFSDSVLKITGYDPKQIGNQTLTLRYGPATSPVTRTFTVTVAPTQRITFDSNGTGASAPTPAYLDYKYKAKMPAVPTVTRAGYSFQGWYTDEVKGSKLAKGSKISQTGPFTLYAHWKANSYTVKFDANGGKTKTTSKKVVYASAYGTLPTPTRSNHQFQGWYDAATNGNLVNKDTVYRPTTPGTHTLYAHWIAT